MPNDAQILAEFVLEKLPQEPLIRRVAITRALAGVTANGRIRADLLSMANMLEDIEHDHRQLVLKFKQRQAS